MVETEIRAHGLHEGPSGCNLSSYLKQQQALEQTAQKV